MTSTSVTRDCKSPGLPTVAKVVWNPWFFPPKETLEMEEIVEEYILGKGLESTLKLYRLMYELEGGGK